MAERAHQMWPNIKKYVSSFRESPKKAPQIASYATIKEACEDPLTVTSAIFAQVPDRWPNGSLLGAVIERP